jgi:hypothetical protein
MNPEEIDPQVSFDKLEAATATLQKEKEFFFALIADPINGIIVNRIIHLSNFYQMASTQIPEYLSKEAVKLFPNDPLQTASILCMLLREITRVARLASYLCVKGIVPQALALTRSAVEQIGVYTHIWNQPDKAKFVTDPDSDDYGFAFRRSNDKALNSQLRIKETKYRFMHCKAGAQISNLYKLLSAHFIHGLGAALTNKNEEYSCEFVDRATPKELETQYKLLQLILGMIFNEILQSLPKEDWFEEDIAALILLSGIFLPTLSFSPDDKNETLKSQVDELFAALTKTMA